MYHGGGCQREAVKIQAHDGVRTNVKPARKTKKEYNGFRRESLTDENTQIMEPKNKGTEVIHKGDKHHTQAGYSIFENNKR